MKKTSLLILAVLFSVSLVAQCEIHNKVQADGSMLYCPGAFSGFEAVSADITMKETEFIRNYVFKLLNFGNILVVVVSYKGRSLPSGS